MPEAKSGNTVKVHYRGTLQIDANHPLAGKDLIFELELMEVA
jgi:FKBP-type peptidyl-prolyl cis-trans isomerase 2